ncbi:MAG: error-prone DNA polymerase [Actinobacteria bacterium]|nr:error-prone DNA polymerase [Actinomycetota bacterium]MBU1608309.1 error-prone DNA polymerase [Actinomycetota bacterium]MBU2315259.1 error-prone DNA polymerase [Actinomycetota bacterium]MBU2386248.1 error-prone DNA polymerase [Actinomycetota bacterium]
MAGWHNPPIPWSEFERSLRNGNRPGTAPPPGADGGDSPAWSQKRAPYRAAGLERPDPATVVPYAELHAHSSFSFLDGASSPEELLEEAARLGLSGLALTDHDGFYGVVRLAEAAEPYGLTTVFGAELSLGLTGTQQGVADPEGTHLLVLARGQAGYHRLAAAITEAQLAGGEKGRPVYDLDALAEHAGRGGEATSGDHWMILTGCRKGAVRSALEGRDTRRAGNDGAASDGVARARPTPAHIAAAGAELDALVDRFGASSVVVELFDHGRPLDTVHNDVLAALAAERGLPIVATGAVHYATPARHPLATAFAGLRARRSLDEMEGWLPAAGTAHLRSGAEMQRLFTRYPGAVARSVELATELGFPLRQAKPKLPKQPVPPGHTPMSWLRELVWAAVPRKYPDASDDDRARIARELDVIELKDFPGYFLIVHEIVQFARSRGILCQGRGSAANSAVCYLLDITAVDSIGYQLPFERFLSALRDEEPDIDVDFDSDRREEVIQYVYERYGRRNAAQVANVISYRPKNAVRDMARALGYSTGQQDAWSRQVERWGAVLSSDDHDIPAPVVDLAQQVLTYPRHLGIHSGGMVLTDRPVGEIVPIEHARMENRTVLQWDKDDCAWMGLVKFDLLGLGMLAALQHSFDLMDAHLGERWELSTLPKEEQATYDMLCRADSIGVFQVESRAQMGLLPRLQPRKFYDLVVQIALVRPGPIQGGAVHPFVRRKLGQEPITYDHPKLKGPLERTLGIPVFQEQLMQVAMAVGGCTGDDADLLRRAMGSKRGLERIESLRATLYAGMAGNGITGELADEIYGRIQAFANFGFAESHSLSFALLVYASSWIKLHYPGVFLASLLRAQPMGFYSPASLTADAERHGVEVRTPCILRSEVDAGLERLDLVVASAHEPVAPDARRAAATGLESCIQRRQPPVPAFDPASTDGDLNDCARHRRDGHLAVRLGLAGVTGIGRPTAERIVAERERGGPYRDLTELVYRTGLTAAQVEALATAGAFDVLGLSRREALWAAGAAAQARPEYLPGIVTAVQPPLFTELDGYETMVANLVSTGIAPGDHPVRFVRELLRERGVLSARELRGAEPNRRVEVAGVVTHRQRPATASGITFLNLEDETGLVNVICSVGLWSRYRRTVRESRALIVRGVLERSAEGVINVVADRVEQLPLRVTMPSRDFR